MVRDGQSAYVDDIVLVLTPGGASPAPTFNRGVD